MGSHLQDYLTGVYGGHRCELYARATTGLYLLFAELCRRKGAGNVIVPSICCESVALAVVYSGLTPVIADVDPATLCLSAGAVREDLTPATRAIVLAYMFGNLCDPKPFLEMKQDRDIVVIEDVALAVGGQMHGQPAGTSADVTLLSFADDKIVRGTGGALVFRGQEDLVPSEDDCHNLPVVPISQVRRKQLSLRNLCHGLYDLSRAEPDADVSVAFQSVVPYYRDLFVRAGGVADEAAVLRQLQTIDEERVARYARYRYYREQIASDCVEVCDLPPEATCWRCCLLTRDPRLRTPLTERLRQAGVPASNHYFPLDKLFANRIQPGSSHVADRMINLWVDHSVSEEQMATAVRIVNACDGRQEAGRS